jgi:uncharacterized protein
MGYELAEYALVGAAGLVAGGINAMAGGGSLVSFPSLVAVGVDTVSANATNTVALCPGYLGGAVAQRDDLSAAGATHRRLLVGAAAGGLTGAVLLVSTSDDLFDAIVPFLVLFATLLLAGQGPVKSWLDARRERRGIVDDRPAHVRPSTVVAVFTGAIYGGYFGAGLGIVFLAVLGLLLEEPLRKLNALKSLLSLVINVVAAIFLSFSGEIVWELAAIMAVTSLAGGVIGGKLVRVVNPVALRIFVVLFGIAVAVSLFVRN